MPGLDTNVLVRWLVDDDPEQSAQVHWLFKAARDRQDPLFVPITVMLELEWVLRSRYGFGRGILLNTLTALLETQELEFQSEDAIEQALAFYRQGQADFADCLHASHCAVHERSPMLSFDRKAQRLPGVAALSH